VISKEVSDKKIADLEEAHKKAIESLHSQHKQQMDVMQMLIAEENENRKKIER